MVDPFGEKVRENYRLQGEVRAIKKLFDILNQVIWSEGDKKWAVWLEDVADELAAHGTLCSVDEQGIELIKINPRGV